MKSNSLVFCITNFGCKGDFQNLKKKEIIHSSEQRFYIV